jgi:hypothetical protein
MTMTMTMKEHEHDDKEYEHEYKIYHVIENKNDRMLITEKRLVKDRNFTISLPR